MKLVRPVYDCYILKIHHILHDKTYQAIVKKRIFRQQQIGVFKNV